MKFHFIILLLLVFVSSRAQDSLMVNDSTEHLCLYLCDEFNNFNQRNPESIDTNAKYIINYDELNKSDSFFSMLSNTGQAHYSLNEPFNYRGGFNPYPIVYQKYLKERDDACLFWDVFPYTHIFYIMSGKKQQDLSFRHTQMIAKPLALGIDYRLSDAPGYYENSKTENKNFDVSLNFESPDKRLQLQTIYIHNKLNLEENGGIVNMDDFLFNQEPIRENMDVNLSSAENHLISNEYVLAGSYLLKKIVPDTIIDSLSELKSPGILNMGRIGFSSRFYKSRLWYQDSESDADYYQNPYFPGTGAFDSLNTLLFENECYWTNMLSANHHPKLELKLGLNYQLARWDNYLLNWPHYTYTFIFKNKQNIFSPFLTSKFNFNDQLKFNFSYRYSFGDIYNQNFMLNWGAQYQLKENQFSYQASLRNISPHWKTHAYHSNYFNWGNAWNPATYLINKLNFAGDNLNSHIQFTHVKNLVYYDSTASPMQYSSFIQFAQFFISYRFDHWNIIIRPKLYAQFSSEEEIISVPQLIGGLSLAYHHDIFKKAAHLTTGVEGMTYSPYYAKAYMPATRLFYTQHSEKLGGYYMTNFFVQFLVDRARIFLKYENLMGLAQQYNYVDIPDYPLRDGRITFGVFWMFYD